MPKFGFTEEEVNKWRDESYTLVGQHNVGVVLLHGWSSIPRQVRPIANKLNKQGYWVHVPRLAGHGTRPEDLEKAKCEHWLEDVYQAVDELKAKSGVEKIVIGGVSLGGNLAILANEKIQVDAFVFMGTPIFLRNHFGIWLGLQIFPLFKKYIKKKYPKGVMKDFVINTSYQYYPLVSAAESVRVIRKSLKKLKKVDAPALILQTSGDYLVSKTSPWILYNAIPSQNKKLRWITTRHNGHVFDEEDVADSISIIINFLKSLEEEE